MNYTPFSPAQIYKSNIYLYYYSIGLYICGEIVDSGRGSIPQNVFIRNKLPIVLHHYLLTQAEVQWLTYYGLRVFCHLLGGHLYNSQADEGKDGGLLLLESQKYVGSIIVHHLPHFLPHKKKSFKVMIRYSTPLNLVHAPLLVLD
jgi:hypothetical protein